MSPLLPQVKATDLIRVASSPDGAQRNPDVNSRISLRFIRVTLLNVTEHDNLETGTEKRFASGFDSVTVVRRRRCDRRPRPVRFHRITPEKFEASITIRRRIRTWDGRDEG